MPKPVPPPPLRPAFRTWLVATALLAGTVLLFSRVLGYGFINYDDPRYILNNAHVQAGFTWDSLAWAFADHADYWHPLTWLSHMLDWQWYGDSATGHHFTSIAWHAANAVLALLVFRRLTGAFWSSALAAAIFAWHPLRVESVAWVTERKDVMSGAFFLLTVWAYAAYAERRSANRPAGRAYALTLALFFGGLMSKPSLVTLPAVLLALDFWPLRRANSLSWTSLIVEKIPFAAMSAAIAVVTILMQQSEGAFRLQLSFGARAGNAVVSLVRYGYKLVWPFDLAIVYPHPGWWPAWKIAGATVAVLLVTVLAWRQRHRRPWLAVGWIWYLALLVPSIGLLQVGPQAMADRYTYLATTGPVLALLVTLQEWATAPRTRYALGALGAAAVAGLAARTWDQEGLWRDPVDLYQHALAVTERNDIAHDYLGYTFLMHGRTEEAVREAQLAIDLAPRTAVPHYTLGVAYRQQNRVDDAIRELRTALAIDPNDADTAYRLGALLVATHQMEEATRVLRVALKAQPDFIALQLGLAAASLQHREPEAALAKCQIVFALDEHQAGALFLAGQAFLQLQRTDAARATFRYLLQWHPRHAGAHLALGRILLADNGPEAAAAEFRAALATDPNQPAALYELGRIEDQRGQADAAAAHYERAATSAPDDPAIARAWGRALAQQQRFVEAARQLERAVKNQPQDASAHAELGYLLWLAGDRGRAIAEWEKALALDPAIPGLRERLARIRH